MKAFVICIDWYGPHSRMSLHKAALDDGRYAGLYMARGDVNGIGKQVRYVGLSKSDLPWRVRWPHTSLDMIPNPEMWGGLISYHNAPDLASAGISSRFGDTVDFAESILIYMLQPDLNTAKRVPLPQDAAVIVNRWFDSESPHARRSAPDPAIPDFLEYDPEAGATKAWHDDPPRVRRMSLAEVRALGSIAS